MHYGNDGEHMGSYILLAYHKCHHLFQQERQTQVHHILHMVGSSSNPISPQILEVQLL